MELEEVKVVVFLPKELKEVFEEVLIEEKKDKNLKKEDEGFVFDDFPRKEYASWWGEIKPKKIHLKFLDLKRKVLRKNERELIFVLQADEWVKGWFEFEKDQSKIFVKFRPIKEEEKGMFLVRQILNSIVGIVRWKEIRKKFFMMPWGPRPGQRMEIIKKFGEKFGNLSSLSPLNEKDLEEIIRRKEEGVSKIVTGICLHSDRERRKIVERLNEDKVKKVKEILKNLPSFIKEIVVFTFHPSDVDFLKENRMENMILPTILSASDRNEQLFRHWKLTSEIFSSSDRKVILLPIKELLEDFSEEERKNLDEEAERRTEKILLTLLQNIPPGFQNLSFQQQKERVKADVKLILAVTTKFAKNSLFYLGLEVYSKYWKLGKLYEWGDFYLPTLWAPSELRQPWGF